MEDRESTGINFENLPSDPLKDTVLSRMYVAKQLADYVAQNDFFDATEGELEKKEQALEEMNSKVSIIGNNSDGEVVYEINNIETGYNNMSQQDARLFIISFKDPKNDSGLVWTDVPVSFLKHELAKEKSHRVYNLWNMIALLDYLEWKNNK